MRPKPKLRFKTGINLKKTDANTKANKGITESPVLTTTHVTDPGINPTHSIDESQVEDTSGVETTELLEHLHLLRGTYQKANVDKVAYIEND